MASGVLVLHAIVFSLLFSIYCTTNVQKCDSDTKKITTEKQVLISDCNELPCKLPRNKTVNVEVIFEPIYDVNRVISNVYAWFDSIPIPILDIDRTNACNNLYYASNNELANCPIRAHTKYLYRNRLQIRPTFPKVKATLHWALLDSRNNADLFCFEVAVKVTS